jgi:hypothetical protein
MLRDLYNNLNVERVLSPASVADNTAQVSQEIDLLGKEAYLIAILTGSLADADATFTTLLEEADDDGTGSAGAYTAVADADLNGTEADASFLFSADDSVFKLGYSGSMRFIRLTITPAANASAALLAAVGIYRPTLRGAS